MKRKTICGGCGKFIQEGSLCECKKAAIVEKRKRYKNDEVLVHKPTAEDILPIMDKIKHFNELMEMINDEEE